MYLLSAAGSLLLIIFWSRIDLIPFFIIFAKFGISAALNLNFIISIQVVPTIFASSAFGIANFLARAITIMSSLIAEIEYPYPLIINFTAAVIGAFASFFIIFNLPKF